MKLTTNLILLTFISGLLPISGADGSDLELAIKPLKKGIISLGLKNEKKAFGLAKMVYAHSLAHNVKPEIMVAIMRVESSFDQNVISTTKDFSIAQINYKIWSKEFKRLGYPKLNLKLLKESSNYSIEKMAQILSILSKRHKSESDWFTYYHSKTEKPRTQYKKKVRAALELMDASI